MNTVKFKPSKRAVGVSLIVSGFVLAVTGAVVSATPPGDDGEHKTAVCHVVNGNGSTGFGYNLITLEAHGAHEARDGRVDQIPAVNGCAPVQPPVTTTPPVEPPVTTVPPVQPPVTTVPPVDGCFITDTRTWLPEGSYEVPGDQTGTTRFDITPCGLPVVLPPPAVPPVTTVPHVPHKKAAEVPAADCCCGAPSLVIIVVVAAP